MVYLLHFDRPYVAKTGKGKQRVQHYIGWTPDLEGRVNAHRKGQGARLMEVITAEGIGFQVARVWEGDRKLERKLKNRKKAAGICPCCNARLSHLLHCNGNQEARR